MSHQSLDVPQTTQAEYDAQPKKARKQAVKKVVKKAKKQVVAPVMATVVKRKAGDPVRSKCGDCKDVFFYNTKHLKQGRCGPKHCHCCLMKKGHEALKAQ